MIALSQDPQVREVLESGGVEVESLAELREGVAADHVAREVLRIVTDRPLGVLDGPAQVAADEEA